MMEMDAVLELVPENLRTFTNAQAVKLTCKNRSYEDLAVAVTKVLELIKASASTGSYFVAIPVDQIALLSDQSKKILLIQAMTYLGYNSGFVDHNYKPCFMVAWG